MDPTTTSTNSAAKLSETSNEPDHGGSFGEGLEGQKSLVKQKEAELKDVQDQIESNNQMVKQLTSQRELAVKKLADMDRQIEELTKALNIERLQVESKDKELKNKRTLLQTLKNEENELQEKFDCCRKELDTTAENLSSSQLEEKQMETKLIQIQQFLTMTNAAMDDIDQAIKAKDTVKLSALCNQILAPPAPLSTNTVLTNGTNPIIGPVSGQPFGDVLQVPTSFSNEGNDDSLFDSSVNFDPFAGEDPFEGDDPFRAEEVNLALPEDDPFNPTSSSSSGLTLAQNDPFAPPPPPLHRREFLDK